MHDAPKRDAHSAPISVAAVRQLFAHPAHCEPSQFLRREISARMQERLGLIKIKPERVLDAACGEGRDLLVLQQAYPEAQLLGVDAALPMLSVARDASAASPPRAQHCKHLFQDCWVVIGCTRLLPNLPAPTLPTYPSIVAVLICCGPTSPCIGTRSPTP